MSIVASLDRADLAAVGRELHEFAAELYPICRSITGAGLRQTLALIQQRIPLKIFEVPSGTPVFDWTVPKEWTIRDAFIKDPSGRKVVDFQRCNLHVLNYSTPVNATLPLAELKTHIHSLPDQPEAIPYRTSYYEPKWGFCMAHKELSELREGDYEVFIDSTLEDGNLTYGECHLAGSSTDEVLISCHICHPSLANDNLSGLTIATHLAAMLAKKKLRYSYRFLFIPGTIGAITWLARNQEAAERVKHGLVLTCLGDAGAFHYKKSRRGDAEIDQAMEYVLRQHGEAAEIVEFSPYGYDERQYCSPGFNLPVGCLMRSVWGSFPEYHTSADNLDFISPQSLAGSLRVLAAVVDVLEGNRRYINQKPYCEPQLGRRGLYRATGGDTPAVEMSARLWVLNQSDGGHSLLDIAKRSGLPFGAIRDAAELLCEAGLLRASGEMAAQGG